MGPGPVHSCKDFAIPIYPHHRLHNVFLILIWQCRVLPQQEAMATATREGPQTDNKDNGFYFLPSELS